MSDQPSQSAATRPPVVLLVDDEESILSALKRLLRKEGYDILSAGSAREGLKVFDGMEVDLVVSDHRMPEMTGVEFLSNVKDVSPGTMRILLTGYADMNAVVDAINHGQVYRFVNKPWNDEELKILLRQAIETGRLQKEVQALNALTRKQNEELKALNQDLERKVFERTAQLDQRNKDLSRLYQELETNFVEMVRTFTGLLDLSNPFQGGHAKRTAAMAVSLARKAGLSDGEITEVELGALLHDLGTIGIPDRIVSKAEEELNSEESQIMSKHPEMGREIVERMPRLAPAAQVIAHHHERFDGKGYPNGLKGDAIPLPARIVALCDHYDTLLNHRSYRGRYNPRLALDAVIREKGKRFDPDTVNLFEVLLTGSPRLGGDENEEVAVGFYDLAEGMVLARDLKTSKGLLLLAKGDEVRHLNLEKIKNFHKLDPIVDRIYVVRGSIGRAAKVAR